MITCNYICVVVNGNDRSSVERYMFTVTTQCLQYTIHGIVLLICSYLLLLTAGIYGVSFCNHHFAVAGMRLHEEN